MLVWKSFAGIDTRTKRHLTFTVRRFSFFDSDLFFFSLLLYTFNSVTIIKKHYNSSPQHFHPRGNMNQRTLEQQKNEIYFFYFCWKLRNLFFFFLSSLSLLLSAFYLLCRYFLFFVTFSHVTFSFVFLLLSFLTLSAYDCL